MQVLLRKWHDKHYVWKEATFDRSNYCVDGLFIRQTEILAVKDGNGGKFVSCKYCHENMENKPEVIEKHFLDYEAKRDCLKCMDRQFYNKRSTGVVVTKGENGNYNVQETYTSKMRCVQTWSDVETEAAIAGCKYNQHRRMGVGPVGGWLLDYPDLFAKQITVEALKAKGYEYCGRRDGYFMYDMKMRGTLHAYVNACGIVDHFVGSFRGWGKTFYYSATQDKLFWNANGEYNDKIPYDWGETKYNTIHKKIADLYKENNAK